jgi:CubicO group peptidase (beta-lactamase class C family)
MRKYISVVFLHFFLLSCIPVKSIFLGNADSKDLKRFKSHKIEASSNCFEFERADLQDFDFSVNDWTRDKPDFLTLDEFVARHPVRSFLVIQNDSIKYEYYRKDLDTLDLNPSYSMAKSFVSALLGIAIDDGLIKSIDDSVLTYIPEFKDVELSNKLKIRHLLNHTSGFKSSVIMDVNIYYGENILKQLRNLEIESTPGSHQDYINMNTQIIGIILNRVTGKSIASYMEEKIWKPIQACNDGIWSIDKKNQLEKTFCCLGATSLDYAKFGRLFLNRGMWNGNQIVSENWFNDCIKRDTTEGSSWNYNHSWHIGLKEYGDFMAIGLYKQHIYVNPKKSLIIVALNDRENKLIAERLNWWYIFRQIADQL